MRFIVGCALLVLSTAWVAPHYQAGNDLGPFWTFQGNHVLQTSNKPGRFVDYDVVFATPFENVPQVAVATHVLDWKVRDKIGYKVDLIQVSNKGFKVRITALQTGCIYQVKLSWFATDDPRVKVQYLESDQVGELQVGTGARFQEFQVPFGLPSSGSGDQPSAAAFLIGVNFTQGEPQRITSEITKISIADGITIQLGTGSDNVISFVKLCLITSTYQSLISSGKLGTKPVPSHAWSTGVGDRYEEASMGYTNDLKAGDRGVIFGFTGYETRNSEVNTRMLIRPVLLGSRAISTKYGTWAESRPVEMQLSIIVYKADNFKVFSNQCAEVFNKCNYEGETIKICDQQPDFKGSGFQGPVKSLWVPPGKAVQLYNRVDLEGRQVVYTDSQACLDVLTFSLF